MTKPQTSLEIELTNNNEDVANPEIGAPLDNDAPKNGFDALVSHVRTQHEHSRLEDRHLTQCKLFISPGTATFIDKTVWNSAKTDRGIDRYSI